jgi:hypothetical protein
VIPIGILTAAWALPEHQGRGHFVRLVEAAREIVAEHGCAALVSFVTTKNASALRLRRAGASEVAARYLFLAPSDALSAPKGLPEFRALRATDSAYPPATRSATVFHYATAEQWTEQFIERPQETIRLEGAARVAVLERVGTTDRLQFLSEPDDADITPLLALANRSHEAGRHFFFYTTNRELARRAARCGFRQSDGAIMIFDLPCSAQGEPVRSTALSSMCWSVQPGDRM